MDPFHAKLVAAATGSSLTTLTMTPFDVVKTRLQTQPPQLLRGRMSASTCCQPSRDALCVRNMSSLARPLAAEEIVCIWDRGMLKTERVNGFWDAVRHVFKAEGIAGLWKGSATTLLAGVPASTCYMLIYDHLMRVVLPPLVPTPDLVPLTAGILARTTIASIISPLELIRTNLQSTPLSPGSPNTLRSTLVSVHSLVRTQGWPSLWRGLSPTLWRDVPFSGIYWASYESWKGAFAKRGHTGPWIAFISGATSGITAALLTSPFDVLKTRRQAIIMSHSVSRSNQTIPLLVQIVRTEGTKALFAGIGPRIAKIAPACGIMITCFEGIGGFLTK